MSPSDQHLHANEGPQRHEPLASEAIADFKARVAGLVGFDLEAYKPRQLERRIATLFSRARVANLEAYYRLLEGDLQQLRTFIDGLTINVTEFFRDPVRFQVLEAQVLPSLLERFSRLKIWSAGCSMGAELYSVGILLAELGALDRCELLGTDLDQRILHRAQEARYAPREVRFVPPALRARYFQAEGTHVRFLGSAIRARTRFAPHNLLSDPFEPACHLILCRNVTIYFSQPCTTRLHQRFYHALEPGGTLFVGPTERILNYRELGYEFLGPLFYRRP